MTTSILIGDVRTELRKMRSKSIDCVVTSPPYWGLRDYDVAGQIGLEPTLGEHIDTLSDVFKEIWRVLKPHGTVWLNYGDCYAAAPNGRAASDVVGDDRTFRDKPFSTVGPIADGGVGGRLKAKDLCMIPNRLAIRLQDDGWWVRSEIIWHKPNPMPESVYDRPTTAHEKIFLLTKGEAYFYNHEAIREPVTGGSKAKVAGANSRQNVDRVPRSRKVKVPGGWDCATGSHGTIHREGRTEATYRPDDESAAFATTRNARNVWTIAPRAFREAHFATFPPELARRCVLAGTPPSVCCACGSTEACGGICEIFGRRPGTVLDPFGGAGTVGLVADQLGFDCTLIELNPTYAEMAEKRLSAAAADALAEAAE